MQKPYRVADDTFVIPGYVPIPGHGLAYLSTMVIRGKEPVLVETGSSVHRAEYLEAAFSIVEPKDVRWIFLSHDDRDHSGNLMPVVDRCPNATLVTTFVAVGRMTEYQLPLKRMRWVNDGESWSVGDRTLEAIGPPLFDGPGTRGLWDAKSGVYYSADCFGSLVPSECEELGEIPREARTTVAIRNRSPSRTAIAVSRLATHGYYRPNLRMPQACQPAYKGVRKPCRTDL